MIAEVEALVAPACGNGWPGSIASGVSTGKTSCGSRRRQLRPLLGRELARRAATRTPARSSPGPTSSRQTRYCSATSACARALMAASCSAGVMPSAAHLVDVARELLLQARDAHHEELVEVRGDDGEELQALEQRAPTASRASASTRR